MADARKVLSYRYVQGASSAPSLYEDEDVDYRDDEDEDYDDYDAEAVTEEPLPPSSGHSPSGSSKTLQYATSGHSPSGGSKTLQFAMSSSSSRPPGLPTFDTITEAVNKLQSRYSSPSSSIPNAAHSQPTVRQPTPPYDRPPSTSTTASSYTVATDYAAPIKISQVNRSEPTTRPSFQQPPSLPTIDSGEPLQWTGLDFIEEHDDPFSDRPSSISEQPNHIYLTQVSAIPLIRLLATITLEEYLWRRVIYPPRPPSQLSAASTRSAGSSHRGPPPLPRALPLPRQVLQLPAPSQDIGVQSAVGLVSPPSSVQQPQHNPYNPFHAQALTPPANRILQRRSPAETVTPIDHFRHDTEAYASGRDPLPTYTIPLSCSPTPALQEHARNRRSK